MNWTDIRIIQGGMGIGVSDWRLAQAVSRRGGLGTVSGVAAPHVLAHILQEGDVGGHYRRALKSFPFIDIAERIVNKYFVEGGISKDRPYKAVPAFSLKPPRDLIELTISANFAIVWLAKEGHDGLISINFLEKVQLPHLYSVYGAMLAGVNAITVGAGIPRQFPDVLNAYTKGEPAQYRIDVQGFTGESVSLNFNPSQFFARSVPTLARPAFLPIISSHSLAKILVDKCPGEIDGFVIELPTAGGHNANPRGKPRVFNEKGEPVYGEKDEVNFYVVKSLGLPFWIGGSFGSPKGLAKALSLGARGIQAGTIFALSEESGLSTKYRSEIRRLGYRGELEVLTTMWSPTGFPIKVPNIPDTTFGDDTYKNRKRICSMSYLISLYRREDGTIVSRCSSEPVEKHIKKGGDIKDTENKRCLCNGLLSAIGLGNKGEPTILTLGDDVSSLKFLMRNENDSYTAVQAMEYLLS